MGAGGSSSVSLAETVPLLHAALVTRYTEQLEVLAELVGLSP
jgi:hypothetical protein